MTYFSYYDLRTNFFRKIHMTVLSLLFAMHVDFTMIKRINSVQNNILQTQKRACTLHTIFPLRTSAALY